MSERLGQGWPAIRCERIGKRFVRNDADPYQGLRAKLGSLRFPYFRRDAAPEETYIWALRDVSFEAPAGCVLGVLGANGSGKSVLLKILAQVTKPTTGRAEVRGAVGSILHLGAMLVPELTGRESIYQIGTLLRLRRTAADCHFDEIVSFSGVGAQLDSLVRGYSNGMQLRLAFAVMVFLESDVLLIDEALSVADEEFRQRCAERIRGMAALGQTVVLVSHQPDAMMDLCDRVLILEQGRGQAIGNARLTIEGYRRRMGAGLATVSGT
jgi:ABC-type polysaccharide/polyol phosphate transport system ATPase subunit